MSTHDVVLTFRGFCFGPIGLFQCMTFGCGGKDATCIHSIHPIRLPFQATHTRGSPPICTIAGGDSRMPIVCFFLVGFHDVVCTSSQIAAALVLGFGPIRLYEAEQISVRRICHSCRVHISENISVDFDESGPRTLSPQLVWLFNVAHRGGWSYMAVSTRSRLACSLIWSYCLSSYTSAPPSKVCQEAAKRPKRGSGACQILLYRP
jgi:hypothetical protein